MISTEHQNRISNERLRKFQEALDAELRAPSDDHPFITKARIRSLRDQIAQLQEEIKEYRSLKDGGVKELFIEAVSDLPIALIKARVGRGLSQAALADLIGVKAQQIQRWESELYQKASFDVLMGVAAALNVQVSGRVRIYKRISVDIEKLTSALGELGMSPQIVRTKILPRTTSPDIQDDEIDGRLLLLLGAASSDVLARNVALPNLPMRFKLPGGAQQQRTRAYATYVMALCRVAEKCIDVSPAVLPKKSSDLYSLLFPDENPNFKTAVESCWRLGIPVIALNDSVAFHGACCRVNGRNIVVLKQNSSSSWRWLIDLIHELYHAAHEPPGDFTLIEEDETSAERREGLEERRAQRFAVLTVSKGQADALTEEVAVRAENSMDRMKSAAIEIAKERAFPVGLLANLLAFRLAQSGMDWWGAAQNLQPTNEESPWKVARDAFARLANLKFLSRAEHDLIIQALETPDE